LFAQSDRCRIDDLTDEMLQAKQKGAGGGWYEYALPLIL
jgi:hypothetical protein